MRDAGLFHSFWHPYLWVVALFDSLSPLQLPPLSKLLDEEHTHWVSLGKLIQTDQVRAANKQLHPGSSFVKVPSCSNGIKQLD